MKVYPMELGGYAANCYFLTVGSKVVVVDPGADAGKVVNYLSSNDLELEAILITHAHFDHIGAVKDLVEYYGVKVYAHVREREYYLDAALNLSAKVGRDIVAFDDLSAFHFLNGGERLDLLGAEFSCLHVPGHSPGSVCFYVENLKMIFTGDVLFRYGIGRSDFVHGNHEQLVNGIKDKLLVLSDDVVVYPGHGGASTILDEKNGNPHLK